MYLQSAARLQGEDPITVEVVHGITGVRLPTGHEPPVTAAASCVLTHARVGLRVRRSFGDQAIGDDVVQSYLQRCQAGPFESVEAATRDIVAAGYSVATFINQVRAWVGIGGWGRACARSH